MAGEAYSETVERVASPLVGIMKEALTLVDKFFWILSCNRI